jgi:hypothetical protein
MLILKYFLSVGTVLAVGLIFLSNHMESEKAAADSRRAHTTATLAVTAPPAKPKPAEVSLINEQIAPQGSDNRRSNRR